MHELSLGAVRIRFDFVLILVGVSIVRNPMFGAGLACAVIAHELGHALTARVAAGSPVSVVLQVGGATPYLRRLPSEQGARAVLIGGALGGLVPLAVGLALASLPQAPELARFGREMSYAAFLWTGYQLSPFPPLDGGQLVQRALRTRVASATTAWRIGWGLGFLAAALVAALEPRLLEPVVWLTGMTIILGRAEAGYVRQLDAYAAWERGDHEAVLARVRRVPRWLDRADARRLAELGLASAIELEEVSTAEHFTSLLPATHPAVRSAAEWLLERKRGAGARIAQQVLDAIDAERVKLSEAELAAFAQVLFVYATYEVSKLRLESAVGLLERAEGWGFDDLDRLHADGRLDGLRGHPRFERLVQDLEVRHGPL